MILGLREDRGLGIGKRLLAQGEAEIASRGYGIFRLRVVKFNAALSISDLRHAWRVTRESPNDRLPVTMLEMTFHKGPFVRRAARAAQKITLKQ